MVLSRLKPLFSCLPAPVTDIAVRGQSDCAFIQPSLIILPTLLFLFEDPSRPMQDTN